VKWINIEKGGRVTDSIVVAALQMTSTNKVESNLKKADALLDAAVKAGAALVVLPEYFAYMGLVDTDKLAIAEQDGVGPIQLFLREAARRYRLWIIGGTIPIQSHISGKVLNRSQIWGPEGQCVLNYDKLHLFNFVNGAERYCESDTILAGQEIKTAELPWGAVGVGVCYDLRFPELFKAMRPLDVLALPAAFTWTTGMAHWSVLLRARAIENQCYVIASAQEGIHPSGRKTYGHSQIIDPWGTVLAELPEEEGIITARMMHSEIKRIREALPLAKDQRLSIGLNLNDAGGHAS
jgi:deaminated glutathione amidase